MIAFRDFQHSAVGRPEGLDQALVEANAWLEQHAVTPLSIETLRRLDGGAMKAITSADIGLRIWYEVKAGGS